MLVDQRFITKRPRTIWRKHRNSGAFRHYQHPIRLVPAGSYYQVQYQNERDEWVLVPTPGGSECMSFHTAMWLARRVIRMIFGEAKAG